jgi:hypothetical protein
MENSIKYKGDWYYINEEALPTNRVMQNGDHFEVSVKVTDYIGNQYIMYWEFREQNFETLDLYSYDSPSRVELIREITVNEILDKRVVEIKASANLEGVKSKLEELGFIKGNEAKGITLYTYPKTPLSFVFWISVDVNLITLEYYTRDYEGDWEREKEETLKLVTCLKSLNEVMYEFKRIVEGSSYIDPEFKENIENE